MSGHHFVTCFSTRGHQTQYKTDCKNRRCFHEILLWPNAGFRLGTLQNILLQLQHQIVANPNQKKLSHQVTQILVSIGLYVFGIQHNYPEDKKILCARSVVDFRRCRTESSKWNCLISFADLRSCTQTSGQYQRIGRQCFFPGIAHSKNMHPTNFNSKSSSCQLFCFSTASHAIVRTIFTSLFLLRKFDEF